MEHVENIEECVEEHEGQKKCSKCGEWKDLSEFHKNKSYKDGIDCYCKKCRNLYRINYHLKNQDKMNRYFKEYYKTHGAERIEYHKQYYEDNHLRKLLLGCVTRSYKKNVPCDSIEDLHNYLKPIFDNKRCEHCNTILIYNKKQSKRQDNSFSIDRIIPEKGYVIGNVAILCNKCNIIKSFGTPDEHRSIANWMEQRINEIKNAS